MHEKTLIQSVISHPNRKYLLNELMNGTGRWFYNALSQIQPSQNAEKTRATLRLSIQGYLATLYRIYRKAGWTTLTYHDFYHNDPITTKYVMLFLLNTLDRQYDKLYLAAVLALWIELERRDDDYAEYVRRCTGQDDDEGVEITPFFLYNFVCSTAHDDVQETERLSSVA